jgi:hypothetical protein
MKQQLFLKGVPRGFTLQSCTGITRVYKATLLIIAGFGQRYGFWEKLFPHPNLMMET